MKSINKFLSVDEQIKKLKDKKLIFRNEKSIEMFSEYLHQYNYEVLIKSYKFKDFYQDNEKTFSQDICSDDIRYVFDLDRTISSILWKYFKGIELHFNSTITYVLGKAFEKNLNCPYPSILNMETTKIIFNNYIRKPNLTKKINWYSKNNDESFDIKKYLFQFTNRNNWYQKIIQKNKEEESIEIIDFIENEIESNYNNSNVVKYAFVHIQSLCSSWTFSTLIWIYKALSDDLRQKAREEFFKFVDLDDSSPKIDNQGFLELLEIFSHFRNNLAHNVKIIDYKLNIQSENLAKKISFILNKNILTNKEYNLSYWITIIENIREIKDQKITLEIKESIKDKINNSSYDSNDIVKKIIYENIGF